MIRRHYSLLWLAVALLVLYWAARLFAISAFPPFLDEGIHVSFGRDIMTMGPLAHANEGRQFVMWLYILFGAQTNEPFFISRIANLFVLLPGLAAVIGTGRLLSNRWGGLLAALFIIASAYHHFFDRLALGDTPAAAAVMLAVHFAARLSKRISYADAALCGIALFFACGMKLSTIPYFIVPLIAVIAFQRNRRGLQWGVAALLIACVLTSAYFGIVIWRGYDPLALLVQPSSVSRIQIFLIKAAQIPGMVIDYFGIPATIVLLIAITALIIRRQFFLPLCLFLPLLALLLSPRQTSRHLITPMTLLLLCGAVMLADLLEQHWKLRLPIVAFTFLWTLTLWLPFAWTAALSPVNLQLMANDYAEYINSEASGFGIRELLAVLNEHHPARVIGVLANCVSLRELAPFPVECPRVNPSGEDVEALNQLLAVSRKTNTYAVLEDLVYAPASAPGTPIAVIEVRQPHLTVYDLTP